MKILSTRQLRSRLEILAEQVMATNDVATREQIMECMSKAQRDMNAGDLEGASHWAEFATEIASQAFLARRCR